ncbi:hypothetical protein PsorP6_000759 [Peronosclerospora sorghi]|uniref:Uncharacterized protein n=1 Tax=Peronosclerospora sorghi TaxID=230839 RepID=A0ACC0WS37_9STRA|nr:hypothetical protein PsorP6_000759 [Peronosclerospora sorghi]
MLANSNEFPNIHHEIGRWDIWSPLQALQPTTLSRGDQTMKIPTFSAFNLMCRIPGIPTNEIGGDKAMKIHMFVSYNSMIKNGGD